MKALFIGGTGNISKEVSKLAVARGIDLHLFTRGKKDVTIPGATMVKMDISDTAGVKKYLDQHSFDCIANWVVWNTDGAQRDIDLFQGRTKQYIFISSASAYQKPPSHPVITESTPLVNPHWQYSRNKIACEELFMNAHRENGFPITIVRPSLTYSDWFPMAIGSSGFTLAKRIQEGKKIIVHGDGSSLWTCTHSADFAVGFIGLMNHAQAIGQAFHITSDELLTWNQIYTIMAQAGGYEPNIVHIPSDFIAKIDQAIGDNLLGDKAWSMIFDNSKIKRFVPDFNPTITFRKGMERAWAWFLANPSRQIINEKEDQAIERILAAYEKVTQRELVS